MRPDVAVFCHYDRAGLVRPDTLRFLGELQAAGFSVVVVSNSGLKQPDVLSSVADHVLTRRNIGLDFCAWRMAMRRLDLPRTGTRRILLVNDSVYGPLVPLAPLLAQMDPDQADLWGMTDSEELGWHLQSYFLLAGPALIHSDLWRRFWRGVVPLPLKRWMIARYEIGLSRLVTKAGFQARALFPYAARVADGAVRNPALGAWRELLAAGFPFLKRELLRDNPTQEPDLALWRELVAPDRVAEIERDLARF